jgi:hypothetical protein
MAYIYWIQGEGDTDITTQGYVGYTKRNPKKREWEHRRDGKEGKFHVIAEGTVVDMLALERKLRPVSGIGMNTAPGGSIGGGEAPKSTSMKEKVRQARIGATWSQGTKNKISKTLKGKYIWVTDGTNSKQQLATDPIPEGFKRGRTQDVAGKKNPCYRHGKNIGKKA